MAEQDSAGQPMPVEKDELNSKLAGPANPADGKDSPEENGMGRSLWEHVYQLVKHAHSANQKDRPNEKNELSRHWWEHPGRLAEHINPGEIQDRNSRQMKRVTRISALSSQQQDPGMEYQNEDQPSTEGYLTPKLKHDNTTAQDINQNSISKSSNGPKYDDEVAVDYPPTSFLDSAKSGYEHAKHGIEHVGHRLGFWHDVERENSTSTNASTSTNTTTHFQHQDAFFSSEPSDDPSANDNQAALRNATNPSSSTGLKLAASVPDLSSPGGHRNVTAKKAGFGAMGVVLLFLGLLILGWLLKRKMQRRKGRYTNLEGGSGASGSGRGGGILAKEFEEFEMRDFGDDAADHGRR